MIIHTDGNRIILQEKKDKIYYLGDVPYLGIVNFGNTCFANAVLQLLFHRRLIRYLVLAEPESRNPRLHGLARLFRALETDTRPFDDRRVVDMIEAGFRERMEQRDAYEFLLSLLVTLTEEAVFGAALRSLFEVHYTEETDCEACERSTMERSYFVLDLNGIEDCPSIQEALVAKHEG